MRATRQSEPTAKPGRSCQPRSSGSLQAEETTPTTLVGKWDARPRHACGPAWHHGAPGRTWKRGGRHMPG